MPEIAAVLRHEQHSASAHVQMKVSSSLCLKKKKKVSDCHVLRVWPQTGNICERKHVWWYSEVRTCVCLRFSSHTQAWCAPLPSCSFWGLDQTAVPPAWIEFTLFWKRPAQHIVQRSLSSPSRVLPGRPNKRTWNTQIWWSQPQWPPQ